MNYKTMNNLCIVDVLINISYKNNSVFKNPYLQLQKKIFQQGNLIKTVNIGYSLKTQQFKT